MKKIEIYLSLSKRENDTVPKILLYSFTFRRRVRTMLCPRLVLGRSVCYFKISATIVFLLRRIFQRVQDESLPSKLSFYYKIFKDMEKKCKMHPLFSRQVLKNTNYEKLFAYLTFMVSSASWYWEQNISQFVDNGYNRVVLLSNVLFTLPFSNFPSYTAPDFQFPPHTRSD